MSNIANNEPKISIIVPIYNVEEYLYDCMESINVSIRNIDAEVLLIDDGSPDGSPEIAKSYADTHDKFRYFRKENGGLSDARNFGAARARGTFISFIDSDDLVTPCMYESMLSSAEMHDTDMTIINAVRFNSTSMKQSMLQKPVFDGIINVVTHITERPELICDSTAWNKLIRRSFWEENGFQYPVGWRYEDMPVSLRMHYKARRISIVRQVGYMWRVREGGAKSITQENGNVKNLIHRLAMLEDMFGYFEDEIGIEAHPDMYSAFLRKSLNTDIKLFVDEFVNLNDDAAAEYRDIICDFLAKHYDEEDFGRIRIIDRQKIEFLRAGDFKRLRKLLKYEKSGYKKAPFVRAADGRIRMELDDSLFTVEERDPSVDYTLTYPVNRITDIRFSDEGMLVDLMITIPRLDIASFDEQPVYAWLINDITGDELSFPVKARDNHERTVRAGFVYDRKNDRAAEYNYDGTGSEIILKADVINKDKLAPGTYLLSVHYRNVLGTDWLIVRTDDAKLKRRMSGRRFAWAGKEAEISFDESGSLRLTIREADAGQAKSEANACINAGTGDTSYSLSVSLAPEYAGRKVKLVACREDEEAGVEELKSGMTVSETAGATATAATTEAESSIQAVFDLALGEGGATRTIPEGVYTLQAVCEDLESPESSGISIPVRLGEYDSISVTNEDQQVLLYTATDGAARLECINRWPDDESSADKRRYMVKHQYPEFLKETIDDKLVLIECEEPADLSEILTSEKYGYKVIWALSEPHVETGHAAGAVRKGSSAYYHCLATAGSIISDCDLPKAFKKRDGQRLVRLDPEHDLKHDPNQDPEASGKSAEAVAAELISGAAGTKYDDKGEKKEGFVSKLLTGKLFSRKK